MAGRMYDILSTKAALGMGRDSEGLMERYGSGRRRLTRGGLDDEYHIEGHGVYAGRGPSRRSKKAAASNPWILFIKDYSNFHGISYKDALQSKKACAEYRKLANYTSKEFPCRRGAKRSTSKAPKRNVVNKKCPKGKKLVKTRAFTRKTGKKVKSFERCIRR